MDKDTRNAIERATQRARKVLEEDFAAQLEGDFDVHRDGAVAPKAGGHLTARQAFQRERIVAAIEHKRTAGMSATDSVADYLRDAAFTALNRFVAVKMLEARDLVQECITKGEQSAGYREFCGMAPGLPLLPNSAGYRLYIESLFDELSTEVKVLFDRRDPSSVLWPKRATFEQLLEILNATELARVWGEDETVGWVYQFFNRQDERRKMRGESQAPRNSRELAVRNQFFTPRYVVQFLTDNTLGRIWYEMCGTNTVLADRCEYMVRKPGESFAARTKKDPRDLRVLDPACGSGHFLLYAFDLLLAIYEEAYADPESPRSEATGKTLAEDYPSLDELQKGIPGLILAHNLHGVDIDPRCAQIAQLALWMRAQKAYRDFGIGRAERAQIRRSNIVVAEPLVADEQIAKEFVAKLGDAELGRVFTSLVEALNFAGDLGLLLRVEQLVAREAKRGQTGDLFPVSEQRIRAALARFVNDEDSRANTRRRLFADDAAHGLALLCVAEKKFDTVLMNPPFGQGSMRAKKDFEKTYPRTRNDIYAAFVERGVELLSGRGRLGAITSRTGFFLPRFQRWREEVILQDAPPAVVADLGLGVMDAAMVEAAAYCLEKATGRSVVKTVFLRILEELHDKEAALQAAIAAGKESARSRQLFEVEPSAFRSVPGSPFAYWVSEELRASFAQLRPFETDGRLAKRGVNSNDDSRFLRLAWESCGKKWVPHVKGGPWSPYFADPHMLVNWGMDGRELLAERVTNRKYKFAIVPSRELYRRPGLTWTLRTKSNLSMRVMPSGCIFGSKGPAVIVEGDDGKLLLALAALMNSSVFRALVEFSLAAADAKKGGAARSYEVGVIQRTPVPRLTAVAIERLSRFATRAWELRRSLDTSSETSHAFTQPAVLQVGRATLAEGCAAWRESVRGIDAELASLGTTIDEFCFQLYGVGVADRSAILDGFGTTSSNPAADNNLASDEPSEAAAEDDEDENDDEGEDHGEGSTTMEDGRFLDAVLSWSVGVAFGRFDPRLATGERPIPPQPGPFDLLPSRSPGMYPEGEEPAYRADILVDDKGHSDDLAARAQAAAERVKADTPENLRGWLAKEFFPLHIKMYSKSRRKAPIYWQLATPSASYSVWVYIHAFSKDTLFRIQNDYVAPKLAHEERHLESLTNELRHGATAAQRKALAAQEAFVEELRAFLEEVKRIPALWNPNLDDGVIINFAPLWRLVPQNKSWQKELKSIWDALCEGKHDWAHLAMHLWPERVVPKSAKDHSLAIAHGLEDVFWVEGSDGKWTARKTPTRSVVQLMKERTSPAVKSALKSLLDAPVACGDEGRSRGARRRVAVLAEGREG
jgi:hypothetical protein